MRLHRFYTTEKLEKEVIYTNENHLHQWRNVFRYKEGDSIIFFGDGFEHEYLIQKIEKKVCFLKETSKVPSKTQTKKLTLALALIKRENFELALSKCTELGVTTFIPLITERSLQKEFSRERLEKLLIEAAEQSGWGKVPQLKEVKRTDEIVSTKEIIILDMSGSPFLETSKKNKEAVLCIGPEGGWSSAEIQTFKNSKVEITSMPFGTLRAETAAMIASAFTLINID